MLIECLLRDRIISRTWHRFCYSVNLAFAVIWMSFMSLHLNLLYYLNGYIIMADGSFQNSDSKLSIHPAHSLKLVVPHQEVQSLSLPWAWVRFYFASIWQVCYYMISKRDCKRGYLFHLAVSWGSRPWTPASMLWEAVRSVSADGASWDLRLFPVSSWRANPQLTLLSSLQVTAANDK
jgi:hypothetical protein